MQDNIQELSTLMRTTQIGPGYQIGSLVVGVVVLGGGVVADTVAVKGAAVAPGVATAAETKEIRDDGYRRVTSVHA